MRWAVAVAALVLLLAPHVGAAQAGRELPSPEVRPSERVRTYDLAGALRADARLHFVTLGDARLAVSYGGRGATGPGRRLCLAPCSVPTSPGTYRFWVAPDGHDTPVEAGSASLSEGEHSAFLVRYSDHSILRGVGVAFFALTAIVAIVVAAWASEDEFTLLTLTPLAGGLGLFITGLALVAKGDTARIEPLRW